MKRLTILFSPAVAANIKHYSHLIMNRFLPACILAMCVNLLTACGSDDDNENSPTPPVRALSVLSPLLPTLTLLLILNMTTE